VATCLGVFRAGAGLGRGDAPAGRFSRRFEALLAAATYPGTGRDAPYRLQAEAGRNPYLRESIERSREALYEAA
jgi:hypothetical protein